jgi:hypothetical protein
VSNVPGRAPMSKPGMERTQIRRLRPFRRRPLVEVAQDDDVLALGDESIDDRARLRPGVCACAAAARLGFEVIHQHMDDGAARRADLVLRAVAAEHRSHFVCPVHVGTDRVDTEPGARHHRDVDAAFVVAIDQHDVPVEGP